MSNHEEESQKFEQMESEFALNVSYFDHLSESLRKMNREHDFQVIAEWEEIRNQYRHDMTEGQRVILSYHEVTNTEQFAVVINGIKNVVEKMTDLVEKMEAFIARKNAENESTASANKTIRSDSVWEVSFFTRLGYAALIFVVFKTRVYSAWAIAESICVVLGIGIYPEESQPRIIVGPSDIATFEKLKNDPNAKLNSEAIVNLDIPQVEFSNGFRDGMKSWNRSVQTWLAIYVHSRVKVFRVETTMLVSALWHGTYAGYFMSFGVVAMCAKLEDVIYRLVPVNPETNERPAWFRYLYIHTIRCRGFEMLATGFLLKNGADVHRFWCSIYYWLPLLTIPFYVYDLMNPAPRKLKPKKSE